MCRVAGSRDTKSIPGQKLLQQGADTFIVIDD
jgi:hypothetical protein